MTTFNVDGKVYESGSIPLRLGCEAERMLKVQLADGGFALTMIELYVAMRQAEPQVQPHIHADRVMAADFLTLYKEEEEAAELPLDEPETEDRSEADPEEPTVPATSGLPVSARSE